MKQLLLYALLQAAFLLNASAVGPAISNIRASQRANTKLVDILYDITDADSATLSITVQVSTNAGSSFDLHATAFSGVGFGNRVVPGSDKSITWDAERDWNGGYSDQVRFKLTAHDGWSPPDPDSMVLIPEGSFQMGDAFSEGESDELPVHSVFISSFYIDQYEVNYADFVATLNWAIDNGFNLKQIYRQERIELREALTNTLCFVDETVYHTGDEGIYWLYGTSGEIYGGPHIICKESKVSFPINYVSWFGAAAYCNFKSLSEGLEACYDWVTWECDFSKSGYRLPTETEWEYASRGGLAGRRYSNGDTISSEYAVYSSSASFPVGSKIPNGYGLFDMAGNVNEWCNDWYDYAYYSNSPIVDPQGPVSGTVRVVRGGAYSSSSTYLRSSYRNTAAPEYCAKHYGFRCVRPLGR